VEENEHGVPGRMSTEHQWMVIQTDGKAWSIMDVYSMHIDGERMRSEYLDIDEHGVLRYCEHGVLCGRAKIK
jgi:hypothetical protein